jgi:hypothetical protein
MERFHHKKIDILKLETVGGDAALWEVLHFMIMDHILQNVKQLFVVVSIGTYRQLGSAVNLFNSRIIETLFRCY